MGTSFAFNFLQRKKTKQKNVPKAKSIAEKRTERLRGYMKEDGLCLPESQ